METKQPISFRCENKEEMEAAYKWLLNNDYLDDKWVRFEKEGILYPKGYPYMIGVYHSGDVVRGIGFGEYQNTIPAASLLPNEMLKALKRAL